MMDTDDRLSTSDHDLLVKLSENMSFVRTEVGAMKAQIGGQIADHEARLRLQEAASDRNEGSIRAFRWMMGAIGTFLLAFEIVITWWVGSHK